MTTMPNPPDRRSWSGEEGIALILAMFMVLILSLLGASLATVGRTETMSSLNYKSMSQARYAAESGLHSAANYLIHTYQAPGVDAGDSLANYNMTVSPVRYNNEPVVLTTVTGKLSNYPVEAKRTAFTNNAHGKLDMANTETTYSATALLLSMRQFPDAYSGGNVTIQTWQITGVGEIDGAGAAAVQVSATIETQAVPAYRYAAKWARLGTWPMRRCSSPPMKPTSSPEWRFSSTAAARSTSGEFMANHSRVTWNRISSVCRRHEAQQHGSFKVQCSKFKDGIPISRLCTLSLAL